MLYSELLKSSAGGVITDSLLDIVEDLITVEGLKVRADYGQSLEENTGMIASVLVDFEEGLLLRLVAIVSDFEDDLGCADWIRGKVCCCFYNFRVRHGD